MDLPNSRKFQILCTFTKSNWNRKYSSIDEWISQFLSLNERTFIMTITTSLKEISSFTPCIKGWNDIVAGQNKNILSAEFPVVNALASNSLNDVLWLLGKKKEFKILVEFAKKCADSVAHLQNSDSENAACYAKLSAYYAAATATAAAVAAVAAAAVAAVAAYYAYDAATREEQEKKNKQFLIELIS